MPRKRTGRLRGLWHPPCRAVRPQGDLMASHEDGDELSSRITAALSNAIKAGEVGDATDGMPSGWVFIGSYFDDQGESRMVFSTDDGARLQDTLGLLQLGVAAWNEQARRWVLDDE